MTIAATEVLDLREQIECEWRNNIAPFWLEHAPDPQYGGFRGWISNDLQIDEQAEKGIILNARILWTFSRAHLIYDQRDYRTMAARAFEYLTAHFVDREHGGVFWTVDYQGQPLDPKKRSYAQAFAIFALAEFHLATGDKTALDEALQIFELLERNPRDVTHGGYLETFERDWTLAADQRLSDVDQDEKKSMNTHLHLLEAYAALARATSEPRVKERLRALLEIFLTHIVQPERSYLQMFFDERWTSRSNHVSFGHDIEGSWLLCEAAEILQDADLLSRVRVESLKIAAAVYDHALDDDGALLYEADPSGIISDEKHWWPQTEAVVGFVNAYQLSGEERYFRAAERVWKFISTRLIDREHGEWFWKTSRSGTPAIDMPKVSQWKCPYHNGRMCFEIRTRLSQIAESLPDQSPAGA
jgi:cellobiose epimerase